MPVFAVGNTVASKCRSISVFVGCFKLIIIMINNYLWSLIMVQVRKLRQAKLGFLDPPPPPTRARQSALNTGCHKSLALLFILFIYFFLNDCISVSSLSFFAVSNESMAIELSKIGLSLKIGLPIPKLWNRCQKCLSGN